MSRLLADGSMLLADVVPPGHPLDRIAELILRGHPADRVVCELRNELDGTDLLADPELRHDIDEIERLGEASRSPEEIAFERAWREIMRQVKKQEDEVLFRARRALLEFEREITGAVAERATDWGEHRIVELRRAAREGVERLEARLTATLRQGATEMSALALQSVDLPLIALGLPGVSGSVAASISADVLAVMSAAYPSMIKDVTSTALAQVQGALQRAALGQIGGQQVREQIARAVGSLPQSVDRLKIPGKVFEGAQLRAENIMRTEMNRAYSSVAKIRADSLAQRIPGIGKVWQHQPSHEPRPGHVAMHGVVIFPGDGEKFVLEGRHGTYRIDGPHDPALPAAETVNCHCRIRIAYSAEVAAEQSARRGPAAQPPSKQLPQTAATRGQAAAGKSGRPGKR